MKRRPIILSNEWEIPIEYIASPEAAVMELTYLNGAWTGGDPDDQFLALSRIDELYGFVTFPRAMDPSRFILPAERGRIDIVAEPLELLTRPRVSLGPTLPTLGPHAMQPYDQGPVWDALHVDPSAWPWGRCITLACGRGKTVVGLRHAAMRGLPTLVVCHTINMCHTWAETARERWCLSTPSSAIGFIGDGRKDWEGKALVFSTMPGLLVGDFPPDFYRYFGVVIFDEGDLLGATWLSNMLPLFPGERILLTATHTRRDGNDFLYTAHVGPEVFCDLSQDLTPRCVILDSPIPAEEGGTKNEKERWSKMHGSVRPHIGATITHLSRHQSRVSWAFGVVKDLLDDNRKVLYLGERSAELDHFQQLAAASWGYPSGVVHGSSKTPDEVAKEILKSCRIIWAIQQIAKRGLNQPDIDTVVIGFASFNDPGRLRQTVGRCLRYHNNKNSPLLVILNDAKIGVLNTQAEKLAIALSDEGYEVEWYEYEG